MKLLIMVMNKTDMVPDVVNTLVELDLRGITAVDSEGMMRILAQEAPLFAGLRELVSMPKSYGKMIFGITEDDNILQELHNHLKGIDIDLTDSGIGYAFTIPVTGIVEGPEE